MHVIFFFLWWKNNLKNSTIRPTLNTKKMLWTFKSISKVYLHGSVRNRQKNFNFVQAIRHTTHYKRKIYFFCEHFSHDFFIMEFSTFFFFFRNQKKHFFRVFFVFIMENIIPGKSFFHHLMSDNILHKFDDFFHHIWYFFINFYVFHCCFAECGVFFLLPNWMENHQNLIENHQIWENHH